MKKVHFLIAILLLCCRISAQNHFDALMLDSTSVCVKMAIADKDVKGEWVIGPFLRPKVGIRFWNRNPFLSIAQCERNR